MIDQLIEINTPKINNSYRTAYLPHIGEPLTFPLFFYLHTGTTTDESQTATRRTPATVPLGPHASSWHPPRLSHTPIGVAARLERADAQPQAARPQAPGATPVTPRAGPSRQATTPAAPEPTPLAVSANTTPPPRPGPARPEATPTEPRHFHDSIYRLVHLNPDFHGECWIATRCNTFYNIRNNAFRLSPPAPPTLVITIGEALETAHWTVDEEGNVTHGTDPPTLPRPEAARSPELGLIPNVDPEPNQETRQFYGTMFYLIYSDPDFNGDAWITRPHHNHFYNIRTRQIVRERPAEPALILTNEQAAMRTRWTVNQDGTIVAPVDSQELISPNEMAGQAELAVATPFSDSDGDTPTQGSEPPTRHIRHQRSTRATNFEYRQVPQTETDNSDATSDSNSTRSRSPLGSRTSTPTRPTTPASGFSGTTVVTTNNDPQQELPDDVPIEDREDVREWARRGAEHRQERARQALRRQQEEIRLTAEVAELQQHLEEQRAQREEIRLSAVAEIQRLEQQSAQREEIRLSAVAEIQRLTEEQRDQQEEIRLNQREEIRLNAEVAEMQQHLEEQRTQRDQREEIRLNADVAEIHRQLDEQRAEQRMPQSPHRQSPQQQTARELTRQDQQGATSTNRPSQSPVSTTPQHGSREEDTAPQQIGEENARQKNDLQPASPATENEPPPASPESEMELPPTPPNTESPNHEHPASPAFSEASIQFIYSGNPNNRVSPPPSPTPSDSSVLYLGMMVDMDNPPSQFQREGHHSPEYHPTSASIEEPPQDHQLPQPIPSTGTNTTFKVPTNTYPRTMPARAPPPPAWDGPSTSTGVSHQTPQNTGRRARVPTPTNKKVLCPHCHSERNLKQPFTIDRLRDHIRKAHPNQLRGRTGANPSAPDSGSTNRNQTTSAWHAARREPTLRLRIRPPSPDHTNTQDRRAAHRHQQTTQSRHPRRRNDARRRRRTPPRRSNTSEENGRQYRHDPSRRPRK